MINIILFEPEIPPNTGNIIRTCFATNAKLHIIKPIPFELKPKWLKRPGAGKVLSSIEHEIHNSYQDFLKLYGNKKIYYITRYAMKNYSKINFKKEKDDIFLMFGKESTGIPKSILKNNIDTCLRLPMTHKARSLNLANTVIVVIYEIHRQLEYEGLSLFEVQKGKNWLFK